MELVLHAGQDLRAFTWVQHMILREAKASSGQQALQAPHQGEKAHCSEA